VSRYLVTGCAGFLGSHLVEALLRRDHEVVGIDSFTDYYRRELKELNVEHARAGSAFSLLARDLAVDSIAALLPGIDGIFHLAAQPGVRGSWGESFEIYVRDNILATQRLLEAASHAGVRVLLASTSSVYGNAESYPTHEEMPPRPVSPYGVTKLACESLARTYEECFGLETIVIRYFTVFGPRQRPDMAFARIISALLSEKPFHVFGSGEQSRDFTYVDDAVDATVAAMESPRSGTTYNVGGGGETTLRDVIALVERLAGNRLDVHYEPAAAGDVRRTAADTSRIRSELGWVAQVPLERGLAAQLAASRPARPTLPRSAAARVDYHRVVPGWRILGGGLRGRHPGL
jgi:nucleoside-diphosphate-sugar epimerase